MTGAAVLSCHILGPRDTGITGTHAESKFFMTDTAGISGPVAPVRKNNGGHTGLLGFAPHFQGTVFPKRTIDRNCLYDVSQFRPVNGVANPPTKNNKKKK
jgi:hypothetical protein